MGTSRKAIGALIVAVGLTVLAGCSGGSASSSASAATLAPVNQLAAATKKVDKVNWAISDGEPTSLDPIVLDNYVTPNLCDNLLRLNADYSISEGLATSAEWTNTTTFVIKLRSGVKFWDGKALTADDVVYSMSRNLDTKSTWYGSYALVSTIKATGNLEVTVTFKSHDSTFRSSLSDYPGMIMEKAFSKAAGSDLGTSSKGLMCTGPYKFTSWTAGQNIVITANQNYWDGAPWSVRSSTPSSPTVRR